MLRHHWSVVSSVSLLAVGVLLATAAEPMETKSALESDPAGWLDLLDGKGLNDWKRVPIPPDMTAGQLHDAMARLGAGLMSRSLAALEAGTLQLTPQPEAGVTYARKIDKAEARIDWTRPAAEVDRLIRGLSPFPGAWCEAGGERVKLLKLLWDLVGSEFAARHLQYEMFYAGEPSAVKGREYRAFDWAAAEAMVDRCLASYDVDTPSASTAPVARRNGERGVPPSPSSPSPLVGEGAGG